MRGRDQGHRESLRNFQARVTRAGVQMERYSRGDALEVEVEELGRREAERGNS